VDLLADPIAWLVILALSALGTLGNLALYQVGKQGVDAIQKRFPKIETKQWLRVKRLYEEHGSLILLLAALPGIGSLVTTGAGAMGVRWPAFLLWVMIAKLLRTWVLAIAFYGVYGIFTR
jgi:membrane protein YqaA with SNARE-associated domain